MNIGIEFFIVHCPYCAMPFAITNDFDDRLRQCHNSFYCPRGHSMSYPQESGEERERRLREITIKERDSLVRQRDALMRQRHELAGELAKFKSRRKTGTKTKKAVKK